MDYTFAFKCLQHLAANLLGTENTINNIFFKNQLLYMLGEISIKHVIIFLSKYISKGNMDMIFSPDVGNNPCNPDKQRNQTIEVHKLSYV